MIIPVRCFSCGKVIGDLFEKYQEQLKNNKSPDKVLDELGLKRYCCRRMIVSHSDIIDEFLRYNI
ncbi:MAG: DNA-directed RNA polymerase subunit N [Candidatus Diapherotrites archaeon]|nr:DNA-directed RNA polymerase subunit N [Candidatus Diapherotrites archaeon]